MIAANLHLHLEGARPTPAVLCKPHTHRPRQLQQHCHTVLRSAHIKGVCWSLLCIVSNGRA